MPPMQTVDFTKLDMATLKRYKRHYRLKTPRRRGAPSCRARQPHPPSPLSALPATGWLGRRRLSSCSCILQGRARCNTVRTPRVKNSHHNRARSRPRVCSCVAEVCALSPRQTVATTSMAMAVDPARWIVCDPMAGLLSQGRVVCRMACVAAVRCVCKMRHRTHVWTRSLPHMSSRHVWAGLFCTKNNEQVRSTA
eukprot:scaffold57076_cov66-Phaeocystis_antarctica.AAC.5